MHVDRTEGSAACNASSKEEARTFQDGALAKLRRAGFRVTNARVEVIRTLGETNAALTPYQIRERISVAGVKVDVVSVYRILATLLELGLVHRIGSLNAYYGCRSHAPGPHNTEHIVCGTCGCVAELELPRGAQSAIKDEAGEHGFRVGEIKVEVLGTCGHCSGTN